MIKDSGYSDAEYYDVMGYMMEILIAAAGRHLCRHLAKICAYLAYRWPILVYLSLDVDDECIKNSDMYAIINILRNGNNITLACSNESKAKKIELALKKIEGENSCNHNKGETTVYVLGLPHIDS